MKDIFSNLIHYFLILLFILMFVGLLETGYQVSQFNNYKQVVNENIARYGGLTETAQDKISTFSKKYNKNRFTISSKDMGVKKPYGEEITYEIKAVYSINFIIHKQVSKVSTGSAVSEVR